MIETSAQTDESSLLENQVTELYRNANLANLALLAVALFLAWILWPVADSQALLAWCGYTLVITLASTAITLRYRKSQAQPPNPKLWLNLYSAGVLLSGLGWGAVILFIVPVDARFHLVSAIFVISGLVTASAGSMASLKHGFAIFSIPALLPGAVKLIVLNQTDTVLIGLFICAFLIFLALVALRIHEVILYSLKSRFESARFVVGVQEIHEALLARYDDLERQLKLSTQKILELQAALERKKTEHASFEAVVERRSKSDRHNVLLDKLHGGAWDYNLKTGEIRFSSQWLTMLGYKEEEIASSMEFWKSLLHPDEKTEVLDNFHSHINGRIPEYFSSHRLKSRSGEWIWVFSRGQPVAWGTFGEILNMVCVEIDIEDPETHLAGKLTTMNFKASDWLHSESKFMQRLQYALQTTSIEDVQHALCHICVYAPELPAAGNLLPGNELSRQLATTLVTACRREDPVLELGNNRFVVLLENIPIDTALAKTAALQKIINTHQFTIGGQRFCVKSAIGITPIFDRHKTVTEIFEDAETACGIASSETDDNIFVFQRGNAEFDPGTLEDRLLAKIREILANKRLTLTAASLKPLANAAGDPNKLFWLTATLPDGKSYASAEKELHASAEGTGLGTAFDLCAIAMFRDWALAQAKSYVDLKNIYIFECKPDSILDEKFVVQITQLYANPASPRHILCIAIPEALFLAHDEKIRSLINTLKPAGIKFCLTDFGAGSFSFDYLNKLPVAYLKLHDSLIANIDTDKTSFLTIQYFNEIGRALVFKTLAFCTDTALQETALNKAGTHYIRPPVPEIQSLNAFAPPLAIKPFLPSAHVAPRL